MQPPSRKLFPSIPGLIRRQFDPKGRIAERALGTDLHVRPEQRLAEHQASKAHIGPDPGGTVRINMRGKLGDERGLVRAMYDRTSKPKRGKRGTKRARRSAA